MDFLAVGVIDFANLTFQTVLGQMQDEGPALVKDEVIMFDLASLTKPLTNSMTYFLRPELFNQEMLLCLNHRGSILPWGLLANHTWRQQILSYQVSESSTLYSDFSALRVGLELENLGLDQKKICQQIWNKETTFWTDLPLGVKTPQYGWRNQVPNLASVHDPNAFVINSFCTHAGLFSTIDGLCKTLIKFQDQTDFIGQMKAQLKNPTPRFVCGWDRVENFQDSLAGVMCGPHTFGHLGFTGTSIWIDPDQLRGHIILSNAVKDHWYDKKNLNDFRKKVGQLIWQGVY